MTAAIAICYIPTVKAVRYTVDAAKDLKRHRGVASRIRRCIGEYATDQTSHANNVTRLVGSTAKRMRVGDYRVIFEEAEAELLITKIGPSGGVYGRGDAG
ncbi:MAG: type II toxin-antitoxin system RelE/ParE family toxin [Acetobacteraceae bacterium]